MVTVTALSPLSSVVETGNTKHLYVLDRSTQLRSVPPQMPIARLADPEAPRPNNGTSQPCLGEH